jgi:hypothetical protein
MAAHSWAFVGYVSKMTSKRVGLLSFACRIFQAIGGLWKKPRAPEGKINITGGWLL